MIIKQLDKNYLIFAVVVLVLLGIAGCWPMVSSKEKEGLCIESDNRHKGWFISDLPVFQRGIPPRFLLIASCPIGFQAGASF